MGGGEWTLFVQASERETLQQRIVRAQARWALHREALLAKEAYAARAPKLQQFVVSSIRRQAKHGGRNGSSA